MDLVGDPASSAGELGIDVEEAMMNGNFDSIILSIKISIYKAKSQLEAFYRIFSSPTQSR